MSGSVRAETFASSWDTAVDGPWVGKDYWANPLQDFRIAGGGAECFSSGADRNLALLTASIDDPARGFQTTVRVDKLDAEAAKADGFVGFRIGIKGSFQDYRDSAVRGVGLEAGLSADGRLFIGNPQHASRIIDSNDAWPVSLSLTLAASGARHVLSLSAADRTGAVLAQVALDDVDPQWARGNLALVCHSGAIADSMGVAPESSPQGPRQRDTRRGGDARYRFRDWHVTGDGLVSHPQRAFGPIAFTMYTLSRQTLRLTAQMAPLGPLDSRDAFLELWHPQRSAWVALAQARIDTDARTATFEVTNWRQAQDRRYRVRYRQRLKTAEQIDYYEGVIRSEPAGKRTLTLGALSCHLDFGFPHNELVRNVRLAAPDLLVFSGDQIYEPNGDYDLQREPLDAATLDYLRKWYLFGWAFRDLLRDRPSVMLVDDHDVYQGNVWGAGGKRAHMTRPNDVYDLQKRIIAQDSGGYIQEPAWINTVQRTQASHLPAPYDARAIDQGIGVYFTELRYGGVSFAILEDRKWKSAPKSVLPQARVVNGFATAAGFDPVRDSDAAGAQLLGGRQLEFLERWAGDWTHGTWMKVALSATLFANVHTRPHEDVVRHNDVPIEPVEKDTYAAGDVIVADMDSNGWPQTPRANAIRQLRKAFALHVAGDSHLGLTAQYGIDRWRDGPYVVVSPAIANFWPRRWFPPVAGANAGPGAPRYTGDFSDGFGNKITIYAAANPLRTDVEPKALHERATGFGVIVFDRQTRDITIANWPRWANPADPGASPYRGWPLTINQLDNGFAKSGFSLGEIDLTRGQSHGAQIVRVIAADDRTTIYTLRPPTPIFTPRVREAGRYVVQLLDDEGVIVRQTQVIAAEPPSQPVGNFTE